MMARPLTSKRGSKRSKEKSRSVNKDKRRALSLNKNLSQWLIPLLTARVKDKMMMTEGNLCQLSSPICKKVVATMRESRVMINRTSLATTRKRIDPDETHR